MATLSARTKNALRLALRAKDAGQEMVTLFGVTYGTPTANKIVIADSTLVTDIGKIQSITNGTAAANKALVLSGTSTLNSLGTVTAGTITTLTAGSILCDTYASAAAVTTSESVSILSGDSSGSDSGHMQVDVGTANGTAGNVYLGADNAANVYVGNAGGALGFYDATPVEQLSTAKTTTAIHAALVTLGLFA